jgi:hypothetical protein
VQIPAVLQFPLIPVATAYDPVPFGGIAVDPTVFNSSYVTVPRLSRLISGQYVVQFPVPVVEQFPM